MRAKWSSTVFWHVASYLFSDRLTGTPPIPSLFQAPWRLQGDWKWMVSALLALRLIGVIDFVEEAAAITGSFCVPRSCHRPRDHDAGRQWDRAGKCTRSQTHKLKGTSVSRDMIHLRQYESSQLFARIVEMEESWELRFLSKKQFSRPSLILHSGGRRWNVHCTNFIEQVIQTILILRKHACLNFNRVASDIVSIGENWH